MTGDKAPASSFCPIPEKTTFENVYGSKHGAPKNDICFFLPSVVTQMDDFICVLDTPVTCILKKEKTENNIIYVGAFKKHKTDP